MISVFGLAFALLAASPAHADPTPYTSNSIGGENAHALYNALKNTPETPIGKGSGRGMMKQGDHFSCRHMYLLATYTCDFEGTAQIFDDAVYFSGPYNPKGLYDELAKSLYDALPVAETEKPGLKGSEAYVKAVRKLTVAKFITHDEGMPEIYEIELDR